MLQCPDTVPGRRGVERPGHMGRAGHAQPEADVLREHGRELRREAGGRRDRRAAPPASGRRGLVRHAIRRVRGPVWSAEALGEIHVVGDNQAREMNRGM